MNKIYLGETEVANVGSGGSGGGDYVLNSSFNEMAKVAASALVDLKGLEAKIEKFDESIQAQEDALLAEVHVVEQSKADVSTVYTKNDIDKSDKVVAAALASINERVSSLETPVDLSGYVTYENLNASIGDFTYNKSHIDSSYGVIDASLKAFDASIKELAARPSGGGGSADLSDYYNKSHIDSSYGVIDTSLKYLDASVKELASRPGGGGGSNISKLSDLTNDCDFRPITYITKDDYDDLVEAETLDADTMYIITDLADTDDLASLVSIQDLNIAKAQINDSLSSTANTIITDANTSINYWKTTAC